MQAASFQLSKRYSFKSIWRITFPILVALVMEELLGMTDTAFLGRVGEVELGASAIAGVYFNILYMLGFGFSIGVQIIIGRRNGEAYETGKGFETIGRVFWQGVWFLAGLSIVTSILSYFFSPPLLHSILKSENIYNASVTYVNWRVPGLLFAFMTALFRAFYVGTWETACLTLNSIILVASNILLDWVLIFGHWGAPALGIQGAAMASTIAEGISMVFFIIWAAFTAEKKYGLLHRFLGDAGVRAECLRMAAFLSFHRASGRRRAGHRQHCPEHIRSVVRVLGGFCLHRGHAGK